jgi:hypothetical protein
MTQPKKEQIRDKKTKYSVLTQIPDQNGIGSPKTFGRSSSQTFLKVDGPSNYYDGFLNSLVSKVSGGADENTSPVIVSTVKGPFVITNGQSFTIRIPGINNGFAINISFDSSDIVLIGGQPRVTTSRAVARINSVMQAAASSSFVFAYNESGSIRITTPFSGDTATLTVSDFTAGILQTLGLSTTNTKSVSGVSSPKRGLVTNAPPVPLSAAGNSVRGGKVFLRKLDGDAVLTQATSLVNVGGGQLISDNQPGNQIFGRISDNGGDSFSITYHARGNVQPSFTTSISDFSSLGASNTLSLQILPGASVANSFGVSVVFNGSPVTGASDVVSRINAAWHTSTDGSGLGAGRAICICQAFGPYTFVSGEDMFFITLNGNTPIKVLLDNTVITTSNLVSRINTSINTASQSSQGTASVVSGQVFIRSLDISGSNSTIRVQPGSSGSSPGNDLRGLDKIGLSPGLYSGSVIAKLYGNDEITIQCPSRETNAQILINGGTSTDTKNKMGISSAPSTNNVRVEEDIYSISDVRVAIPEVLDFGEVPVEYDRIFEDFISPGEFTSIDPLGGAVNFGFPALLNKDGQIDFGLLPKILENLGINRLNIGGKLTSSTSIADALKSRATFGYTGDSLSTHTLLAEMPDTNSTGNRVRVYINPSGISISFNASINQSNTSTWIKDIENESASLIQFKHSGVDSGFIFKQVTAAQVSPWADGGGWKEGFKMSASGIDGVSADSSAVLKLGQGYSSTAETTVARIETVANTGDYTLVWKSTSSSAIQQRMYVKPNGTSPGELVFTVNGKWNGAAWVKDLSSSPSQGLQLDGANFKILNRISANNSAWTVWDSTPINIDNSGGTPVTTITGGLSLPSLTNFSGTDWPTLDTRDTNGVVYPMNIDYNSSIWTCFRGAAVGPGIHGYVQSSADPKTGGVFSLAFYTFIPADTIIRSVTISALGAGPGSASSASFDLDNLQSTGQPNWGSIGGAATTDNPSSSSIHTITLTPTVPFLVPTGRIIVVKVAGLGGAGFVSGYTVYHPRFNVTNTKLRLI